MEKIYDEVQQNSFDVNVSELQLEEALIVNEDCSLLEVLDLFIAKKVDAIICTNERGDGLSGIFTERDFVTKLNSRLKDFSDNPNSLVMKDFFSHAPFWVDSEESIKNTLAVMAIKGFRHVPVYCKSQKKYLMLTTRDILKFIADCFPKDVRSWGTKKKWELLEVNIQEEDFVFSPDKKSISGSVFYYPLKKAIYNEAFKVDVNTPILETIDLMASSNVGAVVATEFSSLIKGIFTESDFYKKVLKYPYSELETMALKDFMALNPDTLMDKHILSFAINNMIDFNYRRILIVDEDSYPLSIVSSLDILKFLNFKLFAG